MKNKITKKIPTIDLTEYSFEFQDYFLEILFDAVRESGKNFRVEINDPKLTKRKPDEKIIEIVMGECEVEEFKKIYEMNGLTKGERKDWEKWLSERPNNVREVAQRIVPWKRYMQKGIDDHIGNRYVPISYDEHKDGSITLTCEKVNDVLPPLGGYNVFGMSPNNLTEED